MRLRRFHLIGLTVAMATGLGLSLFGTAMAAELLVGGIVGRMALPLSDGDMLHEALSGLAGSHASKPLHQVRIEQHISIRVMPGGTVTQREMVLEWRDYRESASNEVPFLEKRMGRCVAGGDIDAVEVGDAYHLLLFMHDSTLISAKLEKSCDARDFYSGFLFTRQRDGKLCARRDVLQARSGADCHIERLRRLVLARRP